jgi:hypothetical protein
LSSGALFSAGSGGDPTKVKTMVETWWLHVIRHGLTMKEHITIKIDDDY